MEIPKELGMNWKEVANDIEKGIKKYFNQEKKDKAVIGLSGGLDSTVTSYLTRNAIGSDRVIGVLIPEFYITAPEDIEDAKEVARNLEIRLEYREISPIVFGFSKVIPEIFEKDGEFFRNKNAYENIKPRVRMTILYNFSNMCNGMVVGTSNKSELLLGYFTKYGDGGVDMEPIGDLYKTQVRKLGKYLGIPERILQKKPSPALLPNQTAEADLGLDYEMIDRILFYKYDYSKKELVNEKVASILNIDERTVDNIVRMVEISPHKRKMPPIISLNRLTQIRKMVK